jgi:tetratricopeptide (TPR) repeat protein
MLDVKDGRARPAIARLKELTQQADALRLRPLAAEGVLHLGDALLATKDFASARRELESALDLNKKLGRRTLVARAHHLLGLTLRQAGDSAGAARHLNEARQIVESLRKEARTDDLLTREDLGRILKDAPQTP